jgi:hypothetical protein
MSLSGKFSWLLKFLSKSQYQRIKVILITLFIFIFVPFAEDKLKVKVKDEKLSSANQPEYSKNRQINDFIEAYNQYEKRKEKEKEEKEKNVSIVFI